MHPRALSDDVAVGEMPARDEFAILAKAGFRSLLIVQPDGEVARLIGSAEAGTAAAAVGLAYAYAPAESRRLTDAQTAAFAKALAEMPRPIYACCYSGARAAAAWALAMAPQLAPAAIAEACGAAGFDVTSLKQDIERRHAGVSTPAVIVPPAARPVMPQAAALTISAPAAAVAAEKIIFPRAAGAGGFAVSG